MSENIIELQSNANSSGRATAVERWTRERVFARLARIDRGSLTVIDGPRVERFGNAGDFPRATVFVQDSAFYRALAFRGAMGGAESYMDGSWYSDDLTSTLRVMLQNRSVLDGLGTGLARLAAPSLAVHHRLRRNSIAGSRKNIAEHYDLGNEFFELFLDPTMMYSSGIFESKAASMEDASIAKLDRICRKLDLGPDDHLLEIGTGWGGLAIHAARHFGCRVTTTTISQEQFALAKGRVAEAGLSERVEILLRDYRDLEGQYDKLVSIEMIEAVGHEHLDSFMRICGERLRPDGCALIQAITIEDRHYVADTRRVDFIKRYIFPGGQLVSVDAVNDAAKRETELRLTHLEDFGPHYAETLRRWRETMFRNLDRMRDLGLSERFLRMWDYYLCYCEAGFDERQIGVAQLVFEQPGTRRRSVLERLP